MPDDITWVKGTCTNRLHEGPRDNLMVLQHIVEGGTCEVCLHKERAAGNEPAVMLGAEDPDTDDYGLPHIAQCPFCGATEFEVTQRDQMVAAVELDDNGEFVSQSYMTLGEIFHGGIPMNAVKVECLGCRHAWESDDAFFKDWAKQTRRER